jgi:hypothetical protein
LLTFRVNNYSFPASRVIQTDFYANRHYRFRNSRRRSALRRTRQRLAGGGLFRRVVTHQNFEQLVVSHGLDFYPVTGSVQEILESEEMRALLEKGSFFAVSRRTSKEAERSAVLWARESLDACRETNLLVAGIGGLFFALALAEKLKIPLLQAHLVPFTPTKEFPAVILPASLPETRRFFQSFIAPNNQAGDVAGFARGGQSGAARSSGFAARAVLGTLQFKSSTEKSGSLRFQPVGDSKAFRMERRHARDRLLVS